MPRFGPRWFRALGTPDEPGSMLVTVFQATGDCQVSEVAIGTRVSELFRPREAAQAWLVGG